MSGLPTIEADRLVLDCHRVEDLDAVAILWADPSATLHIGGPTSRQESWFRLLPYRGLWPVLGYGYWAIRERLTSRYVGEVGFADFHRDLEPSIAGIPEAGWVLAPWAHGWGYASDQWLKAHIGRAVQNREFYLMLVFEWAHRLAVLMLPILAGLLSLVYIHKRKFCIFDHLIVAMQYFSFCFLMWAMPNFDSSISTFAALIWRPFNLYLILRSAYGSGRLGAAVKAVTVWLATVTSFACLLTGLLVFALNQI